MTRTQIANIDEKLDIIDHLNQDHSDELLVIANYYSQNSNYTKARIADIFEEGVIIDLFHTDHEQSQLYIPFKIKGSLEEKFSISHITL